ncbi:hypothetical protein ABT071_13975 [Streptomyces sp. NPDC002506]|uniref:hypothetical protein n=1 Tax=Streptomyces sp. NPDC002506 TaxID=3154536 RepID=UPI00332D6962
MSLATASILDGLVSHALSLGRFERVNEHEPKNAPGSGLTCSIVVDQISPIQASGLAATSARLSFTMHLFASMAAASDDLVDRQLLAALDELFTAYTGDFTLGGLLRMVDVLGAYGTGLEATAGYLNSGGQDFRVFTITLPVIVNDLWEQTA